MPGIYPDYPAPIVRNGAVGRELATARWGMPSSQHALMDATKKRAEKLEAKGKPVDLKNMLRMGPRGEWEPPIVRTSTVTGDGADELWEAIERHHEYGTRSGELERRRRLRVVAEVQAMVAERLGARAAARSPRARSVSPPTSPSGGSTPTGPLRYCWQRWPHPRRTRRRAMPERDIDRWQDHYRQAGERDADFETLSGEPLQPLYTPEDVAGIDYERDLGYPGHYPITRGVYHTMYRGRLWTMRQFAGFGTPEETNARYQFLLEQGQGGLSVAFDMPTLMGRDSDDPLRRARSAGAASPPTRSPTSRRCSRASPSATSPRR